MQKIIVVDDDNVQIVLVRTILTKSGYEVITYNDPIKLTSDFKKGNADIILSDINMPGINGMELVHKIREIDIAIPFIMFTSTSDIKTVIEFLKTGVSDYISKPLVPEDLLYRVGKVLKDVNRKKELIKLEVERDLIELEKNKLISWKNLYASKDIKQTKQMMKFFSRTINAEGGYLWLDILNKLKPNRDGKYELAPDLYELITCTASSQRKAFEFISYINNLPKVNLSTFSIEHFMDEMNTISQKILLPILKESKRELSLNFNNLGTQGTVELDLKILKDIMLELTINSIKFSPEKSLIIIEVYKEKMSESDVYMSTNGKVIFSIRNQPKDGKIKGIPYDYTELVFDLFYTLESYLLEHPEEKWSNGTGLYITRQLASNMNIWIECGNISDYNCSKDTQNVQFKLSIPIK